MTRTPASDAALLSWPDFAAAVEARLLAGRESYGDASFERAPGALVGEVEEELLDVAGWAFVLWTRLRALREKLTPRPEKNTSRTGEDP